MPADLNQTQIFVSVVRSQSFTAAASALGVRKSTVSRHIALLEARLGARLLNRTTRSLSLTDEGQRYFHSASRVDRKSTRLNSSHSELSRMPSSA